MKAPKTSNLVPHPPAPGDQPKEPPGQVSRGSPPAGINPSATARCATKATLLPPRGHQPQSAGEQFLPHAGINPIIPWTTPTPRTRGNQPYSGRTTKPQGANPCPHAGINHSHQNNPPRGRHIPPHTQESTLHNRTRSPGSAGQFPRTRRDLPCRPLPAQNRQPVPPRTRQSASGDQPRDCENRLSPLHAGICPAPATPDT